jgi:hypothetical protein
MAGSARIVQLARARLLKSELETRHKAIANELHSVENHLNPDRAQLLTDLTE